MYADIDRLEHQMMEFAPEDEAVIRTCCKAVRDCRQVEMPIDKPFEIYGVLDYIKMLKLLPTLRLVQKWGRISTADHNRRFKNSFMRKVFGIRPEVEILEMLVF